MTDEEKKAIASEYLYSLDTGNDFFHLLDKDAEVFFPRVRCCQRGERV